MIALISDTHVPDQIRQLPSRLIERLHGVDLILHAGDLVCLDVLHSLQAIARTIAVQGNMDEPAVLRRLPRKRLLALAGRRVGLIHGNQAPAIERPTVVCARLRRLSPAKHVVEAMFAPDQNKIRANVECIEKLHNLF